MLYVISRQLHENVVYNWGIVGTFILYRCANKNKAKKFANSVYS